MGGKINYFYEHNVQRELKFYKLSLSLLTNIAFRMINMKFLKLYYEFHNTIYEL